MCSGNNTVEVSRLFIQSTNKSEDVWFMIRGFFLMKGP